MQNSNNMQLTDEEIKQIQSMPTDKCIAYLHMCAERLGLMAVGEYHQCTRIPRRTIYDHIEDEKLKSIEFCSNKLIVMNT